MVDQDQLLINFVEESNQHLQTIEPDLLEIEQHRDSIDFEIINRVFRAVHSVKGAAGFFGLKKIGQLSHVMENILSKLRDKKIEPTADMVDALLAGVDALRAMVEDVGSSEGFNIEKEMLDLNSVLDATGPQGQKVVVSEKAEGRKPKTFEIFEEDIKKFIKSGLSLFTIKVYLKEDLKKNNKTPFDFINNMTTLGQFIDAVLDAESISGLSDCFEQDIAFVFVFATILEQDLVAVALELPPERITPVDMEKYEKTAETEQPTQKKQQQVDHLEMQKEEEQDNKVISDEKSDSGIAEKVSKQIQAEEKIRVGVNVLNDLVNLAGELVLGRNQLTQITMPLTRDTPGLNPVVQHLSRITTEMQEKIMQMRMQPVSMLFGKFHRVVRDLAKGLGKEIKLATYGEEVELDKTIIETLSDPLTHLIRNCVDHAIEMPADRERKGKNRQGTIELKAYHQAGQVHIDISDDGAGIDGGAVGKKAVEKGVITSEQFKSMTEKDLVRLIFKPGFSTAKQVSDVSGRGVGMDVVLTNIEKIGGTVDVETEIGKGTTLKLVLPLTLAIVSGLVTKTGGQVFILPESNIEELVRIKPEELEKRINVIDNAMLLRLREKLLPLINLKHVLGVNGNGTGAEETSAKEPLRVLVARYGSSRVGIIVDSMENVEEIVVKPLPRYVKKMKCYSGTTIMGSGNVALILDIAGLVEKAKLHNLEEVKEEEETTAEEHAAGAKGELQTLLLFDNHTDERFAFPLELITRIERVPVSTIEHIKDIPYLQYQGEKMRLIFLEDYLPVKKPERKEQDKMGVIIPKLVQRPMGIVINSVIGTINASVELDTKTIMSPGLFGSAVIDTKITLFPDMYKLFEMADPELAKLDMEAKKKQSQKPKVLLVDDTAFFRMIESEYLVSAGYEVKVAENGRKALQILEKEIFDAVVLDILMPEMDGYEVIKEIRSEQRWKDLPVLAVTSLGDEISSQKGMDAGFTDWEAKLNKERMLEKLQGMIK